jgi:hypothetical protein
MNLKAKYLKEIELANGKERLKEHHKLIMPPWA